MQNLTRWSRHFIDTSRSRNTRSSHCDTNASFVHSGAGCATDRAARMSVSGGTFVVDSCLSYSSSRTQKRTSLALAEAEDYASVDVFLRGSLRTD